MTVQGLRTVLELRRISCNELEEAPPDKKEIIRSRSFGKLIETPRELKEAVSTHAVRPTEKLREQGSVTGYVSAFVETSRFWRERDQYFNPAGRTLSEQTDYTPVIISCAHSSLKSIYRERYRYKKAVVVLMEIVAKSEIQLNLVSPERAHRKMTDLMEAVDEINSMWGRDTIGYALSGIKGECSLQKKMLSRRFTTKWYELPKVKASLSHC